MWLSATELAQQVRRGRTPQQARAYLLEVLRHVDPKHSTPQTPPPTPVQPNCHVRGGG